MGMGLCGGLGFIGVTNQGWLPPWQLGRKANVTQICWGGGLPPFPGPFCQCEIPSVVLSGCEHQLRVSRSEVIHRLS